MVPVGARLAELARLRLQYDESRRQVQVGRGTQPLLLIRAWYKIIIDFVIFSYNK
jgi:hypothetical protein